MQCATIRLVVLPVTCVRANSYCLIDPRTFAVLLKKSIRCTYGLSPSRSGEPILFVRVHELSRPNVVGTPNSQETVDRVTASRPISSIQVQTLNINIITPKL